MSLTRTLQLGAKISRAEWTRHRRERGTPLTGNLVLLVILVGIAIGLGWLAYSVGRTVASGQKLPYNRLSLFVSVAFVWMTWRSSQYTRIRFERFDPDLLLTTVPNRTAAIGLLGFVYARLKYDTHRSNARPCCWSSGWFRVTEYCYLNRHRCRRNGYPRRCSRNDCADWSGD